MKLSEIDFLLAATTFIVLVVVLMMVFVYGIFIRKKSELMLAQQKKEATFEQELAISQVEMKEQILNYIGQELHDDVGQKLSVARLMTNKIMRAADGDKQAIAKEINLLIGECIQDIRNLSKVFISNQVRHFGFVESLEREIFRIERLELMQVEYHVNNHNLQIDADHALILFRIIQECINNAIKHARSNRLYIKVDDRLANIKIFITDYGRGFQNPQSADGSGLKNIKNRARLINADFSIRSTANFGTEITITYKKKPWNE